MIFFLAWEHSSHLMDPPFIVAAERHALPDSSKVFNMVIMCVPQTTKALPYHFLFVCFVFLGLLGEESVKTVPVWQP